MERTLLSRTLAAVAATMLAVVAAGLPARQVGAAATASAPPAFRLAHRHALPRQDPSTPRPGALAAAGPNPQCSVCAPPLLYDRSPGWDVVAGGYSHTSGPVGQVTIVPVYWDPNPVTYPYSTNYKSIVNAYVTDVAADSGKTSNVYAVANEYYQTHWGATQYIHYNVSSAPEIDDYSPYPPVYPANANGCVPNVTKAMTACVTDLDLGTELINYLTGHGLPTDDSHIYMVMFPSHVETCFNAGAENVCSTSHPGYCAYHAGLSAPGPQFILYGNEPYPDIGGCSGAIGVQSPNGDGVADTVLSSFSHEVNETITDAFSAWNDSAGYENGDECAYTFGNALGGANGTYYNQVINGHHYWTQMEWSNFNYSQGVGQPVSPGDPTLVAGCLQELTNPSGSRIDAYSTPMPTLGSRPVTPSSPNPLAPSSRVAPAGAPVNQRGATAAPIQPAAAPLPKQVPAVDHSAGISASPTSSATPAPPTPVAVLRRAAPHSPRPTWPHAAVAAIASAIRWVAGIFQPGRA